MKKFALLFCLVFLFAGPAASLQAEEGMRGLKVFSHEYSVRAPARFGQGFVSTAFGWTSILTEPWKASQGKKPWSEVLGTSLAYPISYTFLGIWDLGTFWVPDHIGREMAVPWNVFSQPLDVEVS